jgi:hypothetical protein
MASDFEKIRTELVAQEDQASSGQTMFLFLLIAVLVIGAGIGYLVIPRGAASDSAIVAEHNSTAAQTTYKKSELKQMRREALAQFRETQAELRHCASGQRHMSAVLTSYTQRNQAAYNAWQDMFEMTSKMRDASALESTAYVLTGQMQADTREMFQDVALELNAHGRKIDPIKCGELNAAVQRRQRDISLPPVS